MHGAREEGLRRSLRFVDVYALAVGGVVGVGIFYLPNQAAARMGPAAVLAFAIAAVVAVLVVLCYAEAGSRFRGTGGAMAYAQAAFGDTVAFAVGWATWIGRVVSWAALANLFVRSLAAMWPDAQAARAALIALLLGLLTAANLRAVGWGAGLNTALTVARLLPLLLFLAVGMFHIEPAHFTPFAPHGYGELGATTVLVLYAYVGFEGLAIPAAEMRDPQRNVPRALLLGIATVAVLYVGVWAVCTGVLPAVDASTSPVGEAAATFFGRFGTTLVQGGIVMSVVGINAFMALVTPRALYALGHAGLLPPRFAGVDARQVPAPAIWLTSLAVLALALAQTFEALAAISVVARLAQYGTTCLAVLRLRTRADVPPATFRVPLGPVLPLLAVGACGWLALAAETRDLLWGSAAVAAGLLLYVPWRWHRRGRREA